MVPLLFDYYHFAVLDTTIHGTLTAIGLPDLRLDNEAVGLCFRLIPC